MAEAVVMGVGKSLGDLLIKLAATESKSILKVTRNLEEIQKELNRIKGVLKDADEKQEQDSEIQSWVADIREIAYDAEDVIRMSFVMTISADKWYGWLNPGLLRRRHKIGSKIEDIKAEISRLHIASQTYNLLNRAERPSGNAFDDRQQYHHENDDIVVGFESSIEKLVADLVDYRKPGCVVSICGMAGIGKTTLARALYRNDRIRRYFKFTGWASITQQCKPNDAWEQVLFNLVSPSKEERQTIRELRPNELTEKLYMVQLENKCLVILDDIWKAEDWVKLRPAFPTAGKGCSRVLITSRYKNVVPADDSGGSPPHEVDFMSLDEGWELLRRKAFPGERNNPDFTVCKVKEN